MSAKTGRTYRLPTDHESSTAFGIGHRKRESERPVNQRGKIRNVYSRGLEMGPSRRS